MSTESGNTLSAAMPVRPSERIQSLDVLRGVALFGILLVNVMDYASYPATGPNRPASFLVDVLADGSFYPLFSLLFGVGFAIFLDRARARGAFGEWLFVRRVVGLFLIALLQIVFIEDRNILVRYSILALPLLLFWRASARVCAGAAVFCVALAVAPPAVVKQLSERAQADPVRTAAQAQSLQAERQRIMAQAKRVDSTRSYREAVVFKARWAVPGQVAWSVNFLRNPSLLRILAMFLLGAAVWRAGLFTSGLADRRQLGRWAITGIAIGVTGNLLMKLGSEGEPVALVASYPASTSTLLLGDLALTVGYVAAILWLLPPPGAVLSRRFAVVATVGRMGLTNYLWQSVMMALLFLPYGFGLNGRLPVWACALVAMLIYLTHIPISMWWLARHQLGPMEQAWRFFTYGRSTTRIPGRNRAISREAAGT